MGIFGGVTHGLQKGLEYIGGFVSDFIWSVEHAVKDPAPLKDLIPVAKTFVSEILDETGSLLPSIVGSLFTGGDPFAGSRHQYQDWKTRHPH